MCAALTREERREKLNWFLFMIGYFAAGYLATNWVSSQRTAFLDLSLPFERAIPFVPAAIFGYLLVYLSVLLVFIAIDDRDDWHHTVVSFLVATSAAYLLFLLLPVRMTMRPDLSGAAGAATTATRFYYLIDLPYNCFPSLHVTYPVLASLVAWRRHPLLRWVFAAMALAVAISVVLVKQHYLADVLGGVINGGTSFWLATATEKRWSKWFRPSAP